MQEQVIINAIPYDLHVEIYSFLSPLDLYRGKLVDEHVIIDKCTFSLDSFVELLTEVADTDFFDLLWDRFKSEYDLKQAILLSWNGYLIHKYFEQSEKQFDKFFMAYMEESIKRNDPKMFMMIRMQQLQIPFKDSNYMKYMGYGRFLYVTLPLDLKMARFCDLPEYYRGGDINDFYETLFDACKANNLDYVKRLLSFPEYKMYYDSEIMRESTKWANNWKKVMYSTKNKEIFDLLSEYYAAAL